MYEDEFILKTAQLNLSDKHISYLKKLSVEKIDWAKLERKACIHGVDTFIYYSLKKHNFTNLIPAETYNRFQENFYRNAIRNAILLEEIDKLAEIVDDKIILLKGADLMQSLYPNIAIRIMGDIDVLIDEKNATAIWKHLLQKGYKANKNDILVDEETINSRWSKLKTDKFQLNQSAQKVYLFKSKIHYHLFIMEHAHLPALFSEKAMIEIHRNLFHKANLDYITDLVWTEIEKINPSKKIYRLSKEFLLIHLCMHYYGHSSKAPLRMLCDINEIIIKYNDTINWNKIKKLCKNHEIKTKLTTALTYTSSLFRTKIPEYFMDRNLVIESNLNIDVMNKPNPYTAEKVFYNQFFTLKRITKNRDKLIYIIRTVIPIKEWISFHQANSNGRLISAYLKYWRYLFRRHILNQNIRYAD